MKRKGHITFLRACLAYIFAAAVFTLITSVLMDLIYFYHHGTLGPWDKARSSCAIFTFFFLVIMGKPLVSLGHGIITFGQRLFNWRTLSVRRRHCFAYAAGYMIVLTLAAIAVKISPESKTPDTLFWAIAAAYVVIGVCALIAGLCFAAVYEPSQPKHG